MSLVMILHPDNVDPLYVLWAESLGYKIIENRNCPLHSYYLMNTDNIIIEPIETEIEKLPTDEEDKIQYLIKYGYRLKPRNTQGKFFPID